MAKRTDKKQEWEKKIVISEKKEIRIINNDDGTVSFHSDGLSPIEVLGLLRLFEQKMSLRLLKGWSDEKVQS